MGFVHAGLLWLLPLGLIPIIIYYLLRLRSLRVTWGANYVLERAIEQLRKKIRLDQILLMALRILAMLLIVFAFARPVLSGREAKVSGTGLHHVILFDGSYSMGAAEGRETRLELAKEALSELIRTWGRGETWSLCLMGEESRWLVETQSIQSTEAALAELDALVLTEASTSVSRMLSDLAERFSGQPIELFIFADDQATTWSDADRANLPANVQQPVHWLCPPLTQRANAAVTSVIPAINRPLVGHPQQVKVTVQSFADRPMENVPVQLNLDGAFYDLRRVSLLPGQSVDVEFTVVFREQGAFRLSAQVSDDALAYDDRLHAAVEATPTVSIMVVREAGMTGLFTSAWEFFETIRRSLKVAELDDQVLRFSLSDGAFTLSDLADVDVVYLDGGSGVSDETAETLDRYVERGGGLLAAADTRVKPAVWNGLLGERGLLPARLGELRVEQVPGEQYRTIAAQQIDHPSMASLKAPNAADLTKLKLFAWFDLTERTEASSVIAPMDNQQPWALATSEGGGNRILVATGLSGRFSNLYVRQSYVPLVYHLAQYAASGRLHPRTVRRGEPIRMRLDNAQTLDAVTFGPREGAAQPLQPQETPGGLTALVDRRLSSGLYSMLTLRGDQTERTWFAVQGDRMDSNLASLSEAQRSAVDDALSLERSNDWPQLKERLAAGRRGQELYAWVVGALGLAMLGEMFIQRRFVMSRT